METIMRSVRIYQCKDGRQPYVDWEKSLDKAVRARIFARIDRLKLGNFGDHKIIGNGVSELRLSFGSGYRIYYGIDDDVVVILLCGGDKSTQNSDIKIAKKYWADYEGRKNG